MDCKALTNGLKIMQDGTIVPCCRWSTTTEWREAHNIKTSDLSTWFQSPDIIETHNQLQNGVWPAACIRCQEVEVNNATSFRQCSNDSLAHFSPTDIKLMVTAGNTCNFTCQTCNPVQSSKIRSARNKFNIVQLPAPDNKIGDLEFLTCIQDRIKIMAIAGGETFYDKNCVKVTKWAIQNTSAELHLSTNGSVDITEVANSCTVKPTILFSIDATDSLYEYVRFGGVWQEVAANYIKALAAPANIVVYPIASIYTYHKLDKLIDFLIDHQPSLLYFSSTTEHYYRAEAVPPKFRPASIESINQCIKKLQTIDFIGSHKDFVIEQLSAIANTLESAPFNPALFNEWKLHVANNDKMYGTNIRDYDSTLYEMSTYVVA